MGEVPQRRGCRAGDAHPRPSMPAQPARGRAIIAAAHTVCPVPTHLPGSRAGRRSDVDMDVAQTTSFGELLRTLRLEAGLTQEALAEQAAMSARSIQALERGESKPHRDTARRLVAALGLGGEVQARFELAAAPAPRRRLAPMATPTTTSDAAAGTNASAPESVLNLALSSFVGREKEQARVVALLEGARLVTLTGAGGVGKTRLALAVAAGAARTSYPDGVWLVELAALAEPRSGARRGGAGLGVREEAGRPLARHPGRLPAGEARCCWCWTTASTCSRPARRWPTRCCGPARRLRILATSREPLGVRGRAALARALARRRRTRATCRRSSDWRATRRCGCSWPARRSGAPDFALTRANARAVAEVCARLDGIPLAIELAAARVASLAVEGIAARLDDRFRLLTGGPRDALPRQRTLRATLDWSYDLLSARGAGCCWPGSPCSPAAGRWRRRRRSARARGHRGLGGARPAGAAGRQVAGAGGGARAGRCAIGCWRRCASMRRERLAARQAGRRARRRRSATWPGAWRWPSAPSPR